MADEAPALGRRPFWAGLGWKLFAAFASVFAVGVITLWLAVGFVAPTFFERQMAVMMQSTGDMMGGTGTPAMDAALVIAFRDAVTQALLVATAAAVLAAAVASLIVTGRIVGPLRRLAAASRRLADGHYAERVPVPGDDELGDLARSLRRCHPRHPLGSIGTVGQPELRQTVPQGRMLHRTP
jgi:HAMP domain-containing protein